MNILSIGNSFSQDAQRYLHQIAMADGVNIQPFNLYIGGCPLSKHYRNMLSEERVYTLDMNGTSTDFHVCLKEALLNREWDVVTVQQVSHQSPNYDTYQPYLDGLVEYARRLVPKAKIAIHQTWAYEQGSKRLNEELKYSDYKEMLDDIVKSYQKAVEHIGADFIIPSGEVFGAMLEKLLLSALGIFTTLIVCSILMTIFYALLVIGSGLISIDLIKNKFLRRKEKNKPHSKQKRATA